MKLTSRRARRLAAALVLEALPAERAAVEDDRRVLGQMRVDVVDEELEVVVAGEPERVKALATAATSLRCLSSIDR